MYNKEKLEKAVSKQLDLIAKLVQDLRLNRQEKHCRMDTTHSQIRAANYATTLTWTLFFLPHLILKPMPAAAAALPYLYLAVDLPFSIFYQNLTFSFCCQCCGSNDL